MQRFSKKNIDDFEKLLNIKSDFGEHEIRLLEKARAYKFLFERVPGILGVAVGNSVAMKYANKNSDIDLFIITKKNRLWTVRFWTTILMIILGQRKNKKSHSGKFCLSFYISEDGLDLSNIAVNNDIYLAYWTSSLIPILDKDSIFEKFQSVNNWYKLDNIFMSKTDKNSVDNYEKSKILDVSKMNFLDRFYKSFGDFSEYTIKKYGLPKTQKSFQKLGKPYGIIINDTMLKFHDTDKRKEISEKIFT